MSVAPCLRPNLVLSLSHSVGALRPKPPRQIVTERGEPPRQLFIGRGRDFGAQFSLSSPREESHQGSSSSGEEDTQPPNLLSSPREESHQGDSSSGEEVYSTTQPALITEREEPPRQLFIGRGEDFGTQLYPSFDASSRRRSLTSTTGFGALLLLAAACCCLLLLAAAACCWLLLAAACCWLLLLAACCCWLLLLSSSLRRLGSLRADTGDADRAPSRERVVESAERRRPRRSCAGRAVDARTRTAVCAAVRRVTSPRLILLSSSHRRLGSPRAETGDADRAPSRERIVEPTERR